MSSKREKELARAKWERQQARRTTKAARDSVIKRGILAAVIVIGIVAYAVANNSSQTPSALPTQTASTAMPSSSTDSNLLANCASVGPLNTVAKQYSFAPTGGPSATNLSLDTNCGPISIALDSKAPLTSRVMSKLARDKYFDMTACHRLTTSGIYVLQCGDPTGTGSGSPGFKFADENLPKADASGSFTYPRGTIAMANSGPGTNGSQFFIVYRDSPLPPAYSVWGHVVTGLGVVDRIAAAGVQGGGSDGKPALEAKLGAINLK